MNLTKYFIAFAAALPMAQAAFAGPAIARDPAIEAKVEETLARMSLQEKVGQMTELVLDVLGHFDENGEFQLEDGKMDTVFGIYKVGSILNAPGTRAQTPEKWNEIISRIQAKSMEHMGIPCIYGLDQNHGTTYTLGGTFFPQNLGLAATFNRDIVGQGAAITAYETRAGDCPWTYSPTLDLGRDPRWPRIWENFGEDAYVNAEMGAAAVRGFQGPDPNHIGPNNIAACLKHYMGYGVPYSGKDRTPAYISESDLREKHFAPYLAAVRAGALSVMCNSASVNGIPGHVNKRFLTDWLKDGLEWDGMIVTDWADINQLFMREKVAHDLPEATAMAINAGIDMIMEPYSPQVCNVLIDLVNSGEIPMSRIDDATRRILRLKYRLGLFDTPDTHRADYPLFGSAEHEKVAMQAAVESMVLLKNLNHTLPLPQGKKILVTGPNANTMRGLNGGWTYTWQGKLAPGDLEEHNTILEAMQKRFGDKNVSYVPGVTYNEDGDYTAENEPDIAAAVKAAEGVDYIVACIGENSYTETPGNLTDLNLSANQLNLVKELAKTGKPIVLVLNEGRPRLLSSIEPLAAAVVDIIIPGSSGGDALAALLAGDENFSGRLPYTYPREINSLANYDYKISAETETMAGAYDYDAVVSVQWPFGYGQSYTTFAYDNLKVDKPEFGKDDLLTFTVDVTNTGKRAGKEAVLLFSSDLVASRQVPDNRRLRAFDKIELAPGETKTVTLAVPATDLAYVDDSGKWILERGDFKVQVGDKLVNIRCTETVENAK